MFLVVAAGCGDRGGVDPVKSEAPAPDPDSVLHQQLRAGSFQIRVATGTLTEALDATRKARVEAVHHAELLQTLDEFRLVLNEIGASLAQFTEPPPSLEAVRQEFAKYDERRLAAIREANDSHYELFEIAVILEGLIETLPQQPWLPDILNLVRVAIDDLEGAITAMGGEVEEPVDFDREEASP
jgi:hypothetical protein